MSRVARAKIEMATDALRRAMDQLGGNAYDPTARKYARQQLAKAEAWIKEARAAMRTVNENQEQPKADQKEQQQVGAQEENGHDEIFEEAEEVDHDAE